MRISKNKILKAYNRRVFNYSGQITPKIEPTKDNGFYIFPFQLTMGFITSTEIGIINNDNIDILDYSTFQRVFTGLENIIASWEGAYEITKDANEEHLNKAYKVGRNFLGIIGTEGIGATFQPSPISKDFLTQFTEETFSVYITEDLRPSDLFKLYIIPELQTNKWLYIENAVKFFTPDKKLHHIEITFRSLNNTIASSGRAVEEFIHRGAAGEGYAWPKINDKVVEVDPIRNRDVPITSFQVEISGPAAIGTFACMGRPTILGEEDSILSTIFNPNIVAPRLLLPFKILTPTPSIVNTRPTSESDYLIGLWKPTLTEDFTDWKAKFSTSFDISQENNYEGMLKSIHNTTYINTSNPIELGARKYTMWNDNFFFNFSKFYNDLSSPFISSGFEVSGQSNLPQFLCHNYFGLNSITSLPLSIEQNIVWSLKDIPIVGGFLNRLTLGIPLGWNNTNAKIKMSNVPLAIPTVIVDYANKLISPDNNRARIDLNVFKDEDAGNEGIETSGIKSIGTTWKMELTDRFSKVIGGTKEYFNTVDLGQTWATSESGVVVSGKLLWDNTCKPEARHPNTAGYVIDTSTSKLVAKADYRITFYSNNNTIWSGTYQTQAKFTGNIRDWSNTIKFSNWKEDNNQIVNYPKAIVLPDPPNITPPKIYTRISDVLNINANNNIIWKPRSDVSQYSYRLFFTDKGDFWLEDKLYEISSGQDQFYIYGYLKLLNNFPVVELISRTFTYSPTVPMNEFLRDYKTFKFNMNMQRWSEELESFSFIVDLNTLRSRPKIFGDNLGAQQTSQIQFKRTTGISSARLATVLIPELKMEFSNNSFIFTLKVSVNARWLDGLTGNIPNRIPRPRGRTPAPEYPIIGIKVSTGNDGIATNYTQDPFNSTDTQKISFKYNISVSNAYFDYE